MSFGIIQKEMMTLRTRPMDVEWHSTVQNSRPGLKDSGKDGNSVEMTNDKTHPCGLAVLQQIGGPWHNTII